MLFFIKASLIIAKPAVLATIFLKILRFYFVVCRRPPAHSQLGALFR